MARTAFHHRSRILNFRLTQQEYEQLRAACEQQGGRCLSEFARTAVLEFARADSTVQQQLECLNRKLSSLIEALDRK